MAKGFNKASGLGVSDNLSPPVSTGGGAPGILCTNCGTPIKTGMRFCTSCGAPVNYRPASPPPERFCVNCGAAIKAGMKFCTNCGNLVSGRPVPTPSGSTVPPISAVPPGSAVPPKKSAVSYIIRIAGIAAALAVICIAAVIIVPKLFGGSGVNVIFTDAEKCSAASDSLDMFDVTYQYPSEYECKDGEYSPEGSYEYKNYVYYGDDGAIINLSVGAANTDALSGNLEEWLADSDFEELGISTNSLMSAARTKDMEALSEDITRALRTSLSESMENGFLDEAEEAGIVVNTNDTEYGFEVTTERDGEEEVYMQFLNCGKGEQYAFLIKGSGLLQAVKIIFEDDYVKCMTAYAYCEENYEEQKKTK